MQSKNTYFSTKYRGIGIRYSYLIDIFNIHNSHIPIRHDI